MPDKKIITQVLSYKKNPIKLLTGIISFVFCTTNISVAQIKWPAATEQTKPWARWWWQGSAVNEKDLSDVMQLYQQANLGGLEITPIYGIQGEEKQFIPFLSDKWMHMFEYTLQEGQKRHLGIDLANATGWPFGGPWVTDSDASKTLLFKTYTVKGGDSLNQIISYEQEPMVRTETKKIINPNEIKNPLSLNGSDSMQSWALNQVIFKRQIPLAGLTAYNTDGTYLDLTENVDNKGQLHWKAPKGNWTLYALFQGMHGKMVERAAPGGEGFVIDHFSKTALQRYLQHFDSAFGKYSLQGLRGFFNDSYEVDDAVGQADFTPQLFTEFEKRRGYDLKKYLPLLLNKKDSSEQALRVLSDYRKTIGEMLLENFTETWEKWGAAKNKLIRNQSHGSPANILDLYAAVDIPETEGEDELRFKFATSVANVTGKSLASSESATWLKDHFLASLSDVKKAIDLYFLGGVNHIFYHGIAYSPLSEPWPGRLFYASVHFEPSDPQWNNFSELNRYITDCQSFLQAGRSCNDILQYYPLYDSYMKKGRTLLNHYDGMKGFENTAFDDNATQMLQSGYGFDFISDRQIQTLSFEHQNIQSKGGTYKTILLSAVDYMPKETLEKIYSLAKSGATILVYKHLPKDVPGFGNLADNQQRFNSLLNSLHFNNVNSHVQEAKAGEGKFVLSDDLQTLLSYRALPKYLSSEDTAVHFIRRKYDNGFYYFIDNRSYSIFKGYITVNEPDAKSFVLFNPIRHSSGIVKYTAKGNDRKLYIELAPWETAILQADKNTINGNTFEYFKTVSDPMEIKGNWSLDFLTGGPKLPQKKTLSKPEFWTNMSDTDAVNFSGTAAYSVAFAKPKIKSDMWRLNLGMVNDNVEVWLNNQKITTLIGPDFTVDIPDNLLRQQNNLKIVVSNLMLNRIKYMDRNNLNYKIFYNINFPAHDKKNTGTDGLYTSKNIPLEESGLSGPVTLTPLSFF